MKRVGIGGARRNGNSLQQPDSKSASIHSSTRSRVVQACPPQLRLAYCFVAASGDSGGGGGNLEFVRSSAEQCRLALAMVLALTAIPVTLA